MNVLLTGANGFLGSHILDTLRQRGAAVRILLRRTSETGLIERQLPHVEVCYGSLQEPDSLEAAVRGMDCVIHCAGKTKVVRDRQYYSANLEGARNVVRAANAHKGSLRRLVHISSRAVLGPSTSDAPSSEDDAALPVSDYGRSKLLGEREVTGGCQVPYTVLRPSAVYGPRDRDFLHLFRAVRMRLMPLFDGGRQEVNLVYALDVAEAVWRALEAPQAAGKTYNVASPHVSTARELGEEIARQMHVRALPVRLPAAALYPVCLGQELLSRITGRASVLSRQRYRELRAAGWVCSVERIRRDLGFVARTPLSDGIARTLAWYRRHGWL